MQEDTKRCYAPAAHSALLQCLQLGLQPLCLGLLKICLTTPLMLLMLTCNAAADLAV